MTNQNLSIVVPIHNTPTDQILRCLRSVPGDHPNFQVLVYDDKSDNTDYIGEILGLAETDPKLGYLISSKRHKIFICEENLKLGGVRNKAIEDTESDYIYFLDSDDEVIGDNLIEMYEEVMGTNLQIPYYKENNLDTFTSLITLKTNEKDYLNDPFICETPYFVTSTIYRVGFLRENNIKFDTTGRKFEDIPFTMNVWTKTNSRVMKYPKSTYIYHMEHSGSLTRGQNFMDLYNDKIHWIRWIEENFDLSDHTIVDRLKYESITALDYYMKGVGLMNEDIRKLLDYHKCYKSN